MSNATNVYVTNNPNAWKMYATNDTRAMHVYITNNPRDTHVYLTSLSNDRSATHVYVVNPEALPKPPGHLEKGSNKGHLNWLDELGRITKYVPRERQREAFEALGETLVSQGRFQHAVGLYVNAVWHFGDKGDDAAAMIFQAARVSEYQMHDFGRAHQMYRAAATRYAESTEKQEYYREELEAFLKRRNV